MRRRLPLLLLCTVVIGLIALSLVPLLDRAIARRQARQAIEATEKVLTAAERSGIRPISLRCADLSGAGLLQMRSISCEPALASWGNVGGCGAGGGAGAATAGGAKWVGRGVTGGLVDLQCLSSQAYARGNWFTTFNTRVGTGVLQKWNFGLNIPILYKVGGVSVPTSTMGVYDEDVSADIAGFGDISAEITRKLGITNASMVTLIVTAPTGAYDAQRVGILLPAKLQLGSGVLAVTGQFEHTMDKDWGLILLGGSATYSGWENSIGGFRGSNVTAYGYVGYIRGPFVPSAGVTLMGKFQHDRQAVYDPWSMPLETKSEALPGDQDPLFIASPTLAVEWSTDWLALLLSSAASFSYNGFESVSLTLGVQTSVF